MKKTLFCILVMLVPLMLLATSMSIFNQMREGKFQYDSFRNDRAYRMTQRITYDNDSGAWYENDKWVYYYNNTYSSRIDSLLYYVYVSTTQQFNLTAVYRYQYYPSGRISGLTGYYIYPGMGYIPMISTSCIYDGQNRILHYYLNMRDPMSGELLPFYRYHMVYSGGQILNMYGWTNSDTRDGTYWKSTPTHDGQGRITLELEQESPDSTNWVNSERTETTYHPNDTSNSATYIEFMSEAFPASFGIGLYLVPGMPAQYLSKYWDGTTWINEDRETYTWNSGNNRLISYQEDYWENNAWVPDYLDEFTYDANGNIILMLEKEWSRSWDEIYKEEVSWQQYTGNDDETTPNVSDLKLKAYPVPFNEQVTIVPESKYPQDISVSVYNIKGQMLQSFTGQPGNSIVWNGKTASGAACANGIYFIKANQNGTETTTRVIKLK